MKKKKIKLPQWEYDLKETAINALLLGEEKFIKNVQEYEKNDPYAKVRSSVERLKEAYLFCISEGRAGNPLPMHFNPDLLSNRASPLADLFKAPPIPAGGATLKFERYKKQ